MRGGGSQAGPASAVRAPGAAPGGGGGHHVAVITPPTYRYSCYNRRPFAPFPKRRANWRELGDAVGYPPPGIGDVEWTCLIDWRNLAFVEAMVK